MSNLRVSLYREGTVARVGTIERNNTDGSIFKYLNEYADDSAAIPLSQSLPLSTDAYSEDQFRPYFEGLLAEGNAREALAAELHVRETDYLAILAQCGRDCIGDVIIEDDSDSNPQITSAKNSYEEVSNEQLFCFFRSIPDMSRENVGSRLSLAGAQSKIGLAHMPGSPMSQGWLKPRGLAASTHILKTGSIEKLVSLEFLCMRAAKKCGVRVPEVTLLDFGKPVLAVERFDRVVTIDEEGLRVERIHQEDFAQAFGMTSASKYVELPNGSIASIAQWIRSYAAKPTEDLSQFAKAVCFNYLIGNCDAHLKNISIMYRVGKKGPIRRLSPAYDLVSTSFFDRFSKELAMAVGGARDIRDVKPSSFDRLASSLGITSSYLRSIVAPIVDNAEAAIREAGSESLGPSQEFLPYLADDLQEDIAPRLRVLEEFCNL